MTELLSASLDGQYVFSIVKVGNGLHFMVDHPRLIVNTNPAGSAEPAMKRQKGGTIDDQPQPEQVTWQEPQEVWEERLGEPTPVRGYCRWCDHAY